MTNSESRIVHLEQQLRQDELAIATLKSQVAALQQAVRTAQPTSPYGPAGGGGLYEMTGVVISAGSSATNQTVKQRIGATVITVSTTATVYNDMGAATIATKLIILSQNPGGSFTVVTQSC